MDRAFSIPGSVFMKLTMRAAAKKVTLITTAFVLAVSTLTAAVPFVLSKNASALSAVTSQAELVSAIAGGDSVIDLGASFTTTSQININRNLTLNGHGFTLSPDFSGSPSNDTVLAVVSGNATINDVVIEGLGGTALQGVQVWQSSATLNNVTSRNNDKAGIHVNGSTVTVNNVTTASNGGSYGGVLISAGTLTINGQSRHTSELSQVRRDGGTIVDTNAQYSNLFNIFYSLKAAPAAPAITAPTVNQLITAPNGNVAISWSSVNYANTYDLRVDSEIQTGVTTTSVTKQLTAGSHTIQLRSVAKSGLAGNWGATRTFTVTIPDTTPPTFEITNLSEGQRVGTASNHKLSIQGTFTDPSGGYVQLQLVKPGVGSVGLITTHSPVNAAQLAEFDVTGFTNGTYQLTASATDYLGNALPVQAINFVIDNINPTLTVKPESVGDSTSKQFQNVSFKLYDEDQVDKVVVNGVVKDLNDNNWSDLNGVAPGVFGAVEGANTIELYDVAGNKTAFEFTLDTQAPQAPIDLGWKGNGGELAVNGITNVRDGVLSWKAVNPSEVDHYVYKFWTNISGYQDDASNPWSDSFSYVVKTADGGHVPTGFSDKQGTYFFCIEAVDVAGNNSGCSATYSVVFDETTPTVTSLSYSPSTLTNGDVIATITFNESVSTISADWTVVSGTDNKVFTKTYTSNVMNEAVNYTDAAGNEGQAFVTIDWIDKVAPVITSPITSGTTIRGIAIFSVNDPTAVVRVNGTPTTSTQLSGNGTYTVIATDLAGNVSNTFVVTINNAQTVNLNPINLQTATPLITGSALWVVDPASVGSVAAAIDGTPYAATIDATGNWSLQVSEPLENGLHTLTVNGATFEFTTSVPASLLTPAITSPAAAATVLGDDTTGGTEGVEGTSTEKNLAAAVDTDSTDGTVLGMAWYWWLLILAALATLIWWIIAALRNRAAQN